MEAPAISEKLGDVFYLYNEPSEREKGQKSIEQTDASMKSDSPGPRRHRPHVSSLSLSAPGPPPPKYRRSDSEWGMQPREQAMPVQAANEFAPDQINHGPSRHGAYPCPSDAAQARNMNM